jgi:hypothetical protein
VNMINTIFLFLSFIPLNLISTQSATSQSPRILKDKGGIFLPEKMKEAVNKFNPNFKVWRVEDYAPTIANDIQYKDQLLIAPFALIVDANKDGVLDVILDGHDNQKAIMICVVSSKGSYRVVSIVERECELVEPKTIKHVFDGKEELGLGYFLAEGHGKIVFQVLNPQQSDAKGELLSDGGIFEYSYKNGKFVESVQIP